MKLIFDKLFLFQDTLCREPYYSVIQKLCYIGLIIAGMGFLIGIVGIIIWRFG